MDTRIKIVDAAEFNRRLDQWRSQGIAVTVASGSFDPLLAAHAALAAGARPEGGRLAIVLTESTDPILEPRARAELAAALASVDLVTFTGPGLPPPDLNWDQTHAAAASSFVAHVLERMS